MGRLQANVKVGIDLQRNINLAFNALKAAFYKPSIPFSIHQAIHQYRSTKVINDRVQLHSLTQTGMNYRAGIIREGYRSAVGLSKCTVTILLLFFSFFPPPLLFFLFFLSMLRRQHRMLHPDLCLIHTAGWSVAQKAHFCQAGKLETS